MNSCYRCGGAERLSLKDKRKKVPTYQCGPCRHDDYLRHRETRKQQRVTHAQFDMDAWNIRSKETISRISKRFTNSPAKL